MQFKATVEERLRREIVIDAQTPAEATDKLAEMYKNEQIVLDYKDFVSVRFDAVEVEEEPEQHGEYARLNGEIRRYQKRLKEIEAALESIYEEKAGIQQSIGEIEGALLEMADMDGLDDPCEAFDY